MVAVSLNQMGELLWIAGGGDELVASCEDGLSDRATQPSSASRDQPDLRHHILSITKRAFASSPDRAAQRIHESEIIATDTSKILLASLQY